MTQATCVILQAALEWSGTIPLEDPAFMPGSRHWQRKIAPNVYANLFIIITCIEYTALYYIII